MADNKLDVRVYIVDEPKAKTLAFASIAVNDIIAVRGVRVVDGDNGKFVSMPQSQDKNTGRYHDVAAPATDELRKEINKAVLDEYNRISSLAPDKRGYDKPDINASNGINADNIKLDIQVFPIKEPQGSTKAFAKITVDDLITIHGVRVVGGEKGNFVTMPQSKDEKDGKPEYFDQAFPINGDLRKKISKDVLDKFESGDKSKDKSLADGLKKGAEKAAGQTPAQRESAPKSRAGAEAIG